MTRESKSIIVCRKEVKIESELLFDCIFVHLHL